MFKTIVFLFITLLFFGCESSTYTSSNQITSNSIRGVVVDGYIDGASLCLDTNLNGTCDEPTIATRTNSNGSFLFSNLDIDTNKTKLISIMAKDGVDSSTQKDFQCQLKTIIDPSKNNDNVVISPLTDLVAVSFLDSDNKDAIALEDAQNTVSQILGLPKESLSKNPMEDINIFTKSQELQHTKQLIETALIKRLSLDSKIIKEKLKSELLAHELNIHQVLIAMEINFNIDIPNNEETFIKNQIVELKNALHSLAQDTSLDINNLNRLQKAIDKEQTIANQKLQEAKNNEPIEVVKISITPQSITQSIFDKEGAILDQQACRATNGYNYLTYSNTEETKNEDTTNGISIKTDGDGTSLVKIFYPTLEYPKTPYDATIVFPNNDYYFSFNNAWVNNPNRTIYVMTPNQSDNTIYDCYRFELDSTNARDIKGVKVFRYEDI
ncbi:hypothetical protein MNB_SM-3-803 [hydrothermal vent metagenome]|uniref:Lipoprotein n=1 Tax=hydrothermal vent metagenome TaxID=652676 RepID=A0A1W1D5G5_9ZZZZ